MKEGKIKADRTTWLSGFGLLAIVVVMGLMLFAPRMGHGPGVRTRDDARAVELAVLLFENANGRLPDVGSSAFDSDDAEGRSLAEILLGKEAKGFEVQNQDKFPFLRIATATSPGKRGVLFGKDGKVLGIYDGWGEPFEILLRKPGERGITLVHRGKTVTVERPVVVFSKGEDRIAGTKDDVRTWE